MHIVLVRLPVLVLVVAPLLDTAGHHNLEVADRAELVDRLKSLVMQSYYLNYEEQHGCIIILMHAIN